MKWIKKEKLRPRHNNKRIIKKFALFPITIDKETRWLEWVKIEQYYSGARYINSGFETGLQCWLNERFID